MTDAVPISKTPGRIRRWLRRTWDRLWRVLPWAVLLVLALGVVGHLLRDRSVPLALLFYIPLLPVGAFAVIHDLAHRGRCLPRIRFGYAAIGIGAILLSVTAMWGNRPTTGASASGTGAGVSVLHWNVLWGESRGGEERWRRLRHDIVRHRPDVILLSEGPGEIGSQPLLLELGPEWREVRAVREGGRYRYRLVILSRWPVRIEGEAPITNGHALSATVMSDTHAIRLLFVDAESNPLVSRTPRLADVARLCRAARDEGRPFDLVAGDFNTVGRSIGFDRLRSDGYTLASEVSDGWRGTFPSWCPLYDIDHVWVRDGLGVADCTLYTNLATDHRGQVVRIVWPSVGQVK